MFKLIKLLLKFMGVVGDFGKAKEAHGKMWYTSETLWTNLVVFIALLFQNYLGLALSAEEQVAIVTFINIVLRLVTKEPLIWSKSADSDN